MDWPKIKHPMACMFVLQLPLIFDFCAALLDCFLALKIPVYGFFVMLAILIGEILWCIWWLCKNMEDNLELYELLNRVAEDRQSGGSLRCDRNGSTRREIQARILRRAVHFGSPAPITPGAVQPVCLRHRHCNRVESGLAVYSVEFLDETMYRAILEDAQERFRGIPDGKIAAINGPDTGRRYRPWSVILLADRITEEVRQLARKGESGGSAWLVPCVAECSTGRYDMQNLLGTYENREGGAELTLAMGALNPTDFVYVHDAAVERIRLTALPGAKRGAPEKSVDYDPEMTLWDAMKQIRQNRDQAFAGDYRYAKRMLRTMKNREIHMVDQAIFLKEGNRLTSSTFTREGQLLHLRLGDTWLTGLLGSELLCGSGSARNMSELQAAEHARRQITAEERAKLRSVLGNCLQEQGYQVCWEN